MKYNPTTSNRGVVDTKWKGLQVIKSLDIVATAYESTPAEMEAAKRVILAHDPLATDIVEMLGLDE